jgi:hypothetical protein
VLYVGVRQPREGAENKNVAGFFHAFIFTPEVNQLQFLSLEQVVPADSWARVTDMQRGK